MSERGWVDRPRIAAQEYGLPLKCPNETCNYRWLKLPGLKTRQCPDHKTDLISCRRARG